MASAFALTAPGGPELIVILVLAVLLFGAKKLPDLGSAVGQSIKNFKKGIDEGKASSEEEPAESQAASQTPSQAASKTPPSKTPSSDA